ncbi:unnamed protein product [Meloidogyne enterolobii]|uniref:Uncharacterized protein n=1 Tax=Meloidogyne enterolobii TaxID=390850 RepID=A0ACB0ZLI5_MELEN
MLAKILIVSIFLFSVEGKNDCAVLGGSCNFPQKCCATSSFNSKLQCCGFGLHCATNTCCIRNGGKLKVI